jgi:hypothetical protein
MPLRPRASYRPLLRGLQPASCDVRGHHSYWLGYDSQGNLSSVQPGPTQVDSFTHRDGAAPDTNKWTKSVGAGGTATIQGNNLMLATTSTASSQATVASKAAATTDTEASIAYYFPDNGARTALRIYSRYTTSSSYRVEVRSDDATGYLFKQVGSTSTQIATFPVNVTTNWQNLVLHGQGDQVLATYWQYGLRRASEILKAASIFFATELDGPTGK